MIFAAAIERPAMFLMLCDKDLDILRTGRTLLVNPTATQGLLFNEVILSLHKTNEEAIALLQQVNPQMMGQAPGRVVPRDATENVCEGCNGVMAVESLWKGKCIMCWCEAAEAAAKGKSSGG